MADARMQKEMILPLGVVLERRPGVTRWARWAWRATAVIPGAPQADWKLLSDTDGVTAWHVGTYPLDLHYTEVESYRTALLSGRPTVYVVLYQGADANNEHGIAVREVTVSAVRAMQHQDSSELIVEPVAMPEALAATIHAFCEAHHVETGFYKRRRDKTRVDIVEDGKGDPRIRQTSDVFRSPAALRPRREDG